MESKRRYWMVRLGERSANADRLIADGQIGVRFVNNVDLTPFITSNSTKFHSAVKGFVEADDPKKSKVGVGLAIGNLWVVTSDISIGDVVVSAVNSQTLAIGTVTGPYLYVPGDATAPHRRAVEWDSRLVDRASLGPELRRSTSIPSTVYSLDHYAQEIELLRQGEHAGQDESVDDADAWGGFRLEAQLETFLVENWTSTELGAAYEIFSDPESGNGQQFPTDTGRIDILALSKDGSRILVIELKRSRASDDVVGQVLRYMGWVKRALARPDQLVEGMIIALEDDLRVRDAISMAPNVRFMTYRVKFELTSQA